jgi:DNA helicase-2/ATP-dependent DNA helicase PcrA
VSDLLEGLNTAQRRAVEHDGGPLIVLAGPGTGKTRVITRRVEHLVRERGAAPESVLAVTFTVKAAAQMRERLAQRIGPAAAERVSTHTLHRLGQKLIRRFADAAGLPASLQVIDSAQQRRLLRSLIAAHGIAPEQAACGWGAVIAEAIAHIGALRDHAVTPEAAADHADRWAERCESNPDGWDAEERRAQRARLAHFRDMARLYALFDGECRRRGWLTLDDLITGAIRVLRASPGAADICRAEYRHIVVDEFQDVNRAQIELIRLLAPNDSCDLCVVGDDDQAIYGFRGADERAFFRFARLWPAYTQIELAENFRSHRPIIDAANFIVARASSRFAPDKRVTPPADPPPPEPGAGVEAVELDSERDDGDTIAAMILADRAAPTARPWSSYAVIARTHGDIERIAGAMALEGIPHRVARRPGALDDDGVRDCLAWVELLVDPAATWAARRVLSRPPLSAPVGDAIGWELEYLAGQSRADADTPGRFVDWLRERRATHPAVARFLALLDELRAAAIHAPADAAIARIIDAAHIAHADLPSGRDRARRVAALVTFLRFVRSRVPRLDPPADLAAFLAYYRDLDEADAALGDDDKVEPEASPHEDEDAVQLLTAHAAKGLEFDTVFVPRVCPPHGYPKSGDEGLALPDGLLDRAGDTRAPKERQAAEERRIFYVACTRARRRLVILTRKTKSRSKAVHYCQEFTGCDEGRAIAAVRSGADVLAEAGRLGVSRRGGSSSGDPRRELFARARREARIMAAAALDGADQPGGSLPDAIARLREAAARLAAAACIEHAGQPPAWAPEHGVDAYAAELARAAAEN